MVKILEQEFVNKYLQILFPTNFCAKMTGIPNESLGSGKSFQIVESFYRSALVSTLTPLGFLLYFVSERAPPTLSFLSKERACRSSLFVKLSADNFTDKYGLQRPVCKLCSDFLFWCLDSVEPSLPIPNRVMKRALCQ